MHRRERYKVAELDDWDESGNKYEMFVVIDRQRNELLKDAYGLVLRWQRREGRDSAQEWIDRGTNSM